MNVREQLLKTIEQDLEDGEVARWRGQPDPFLSMLENIPAAMAGLICTIVAAGSYLNAGDGGRFFEKMLSLIFVAVGFIPLFMPMIVYQEAKGMLFAITDKRLIQCKKNSKSVTSIALSSIRQVERVEKRGLTTLRIPIAVVHEGDGDYKVKYLDIHGVADGDLAYCLLIQGGSA